MSDDLKERLKNAPHEITKLALDRINLLEDAMRGATIVANASAARIAELEARLKAGREALDSSQSLLAMIYHIGTEINRKFIPPIDWESEDLSKLLAEQITENRAALDPKPTATGETP